ncbi:hypothetical protein HZP64_14555 [Elizabethkingia anophelis]|nr:hypothetical protein [Elizabethkingia anophelis]
MKINEATIDIFRENKQLKAISVVMPIWDKNGIDESTIINLPLFGLKVSVFDDIDANQVIEAAIKSFCKNSERYGEGLEDELKFLGWSICDESDSKVSMSFSISDKDIVIEEIMKTGEKQARMLELA